MKDLNHIIVTHKKSLARITLNRTKVHNALNIEMIRELSLAIDHFSKDDSVIVVLIDASGRNFSAGADLNWMKDGIKQNREQLLAESRELALLFNSIYRSPKIIVSSVQGKVIGGANGITAASDLVIAERNSVFTFSEVRLGLIPATIAPYIFKRSGFRAKEWMLTGRHIPAEEAYAKGLVDQISDQIASDTEEIILHLLKGGPEALKKIKQLFNSELLDQSITNLVEKTAEMIADKRVSEEGQEGINAFFEKRKPNWQYEP